VIGLPACHDLADVRWALAVNDDVSVTVITVDARSKLSARDAKLTVVGQARRTRVR
jgi:hypothetical protein